MFNDSQINLLITESTHIQLESIIKHAEKSKIKNIYLSHIDEPDETKIVEWVEMILGKKNLNIKAAEDGMIINLSNVI